jgi:hypothetical protein
MPDKTQASAQVIDPVAPKNQPSHLAVKCAVAIANYCLTRFPCDQPPHPMLDVPCFAEEIQRCMDEATTIARECKRELEKADAQLTLVLALTDTRSEAFLKAFPPNSVEAVMSPGTGAMPVPGWRVVEKIREALLGKMSE